MIQISWILMKSADLDLHYFQKQLRIFKKLQYMHGHGALSITLYLFEINI